MLIFIDLLQSGTLISRKSPAGTVQLEKGHLQGKKFDDMIFKEEKIIYILASSVLRFYTSKPPIKQKVHD